MGNRMSNENAFVEKGVVERKNRRNYSWSETRWLASNGPVNCARVAQQEGERLS